MGTEVQRLFIVFIHPGSVGCGAMHGDFKGDSAVVHRHKGYNYEMTILADSSGPAFVCPLLLTGQTAVKFCIIKKKVMHRNKILGN